MFKENIGLAKYIAYSYYKLNDNFTYEDYEDLKQEAIIELWKSSNDYVDIGYKFQTYANKRIRRRLYHILNSKRLFTYKRQSNEICEVFFFFVKQKKTVKGVPYKGFFETLKIYRKLHFQAEKNQIPNGV